MNIFIPIVLLATHLTPVPPSMPATSNIDQTQLFSKEEIIQIVSEKQKINTRLEEFVLVLPKPSLYNDAAITIARQNSKKTDKSNDSVKSNMKNSGE